MYRDLGWSTEEHDGRTTLITGADVDALEVPRAAAIVAASWWRYSEGYPDQIRGLPALPDPRQAMVLIAAGGSGLFLARAGECPWERQDPVTTATATSTQGAVVIRWHSMGSRIPLPLLGTPCSGREADGSQARTNEPRWLHLPDQGVRLTSPVVLLHLLAAAAATTRLGPHMLALPHSALAVPIFGGATHP
jgi:hypothetical protein